MPAHADIQGWCGVERPIMDSRFRGNDKSESHELFIEFLRQDTSGWDAGAHPLIAPDRVHAARVGIPASYRASIRPVNLIASTRPPL
jgi:hypothetical protein